MIELALAAIVAVLGAFYAGSFKGRKDKAKEMLEDDLTKAKEVLEVKPSSDTAAALERLSRNGKLSAVQSKPTEHQLKLPL